MPKKRTAKKAAKKRYEGKKPMLLLWTEAERYTIACAAAAQRRPMSQFVQAVSLAEAERICKELDGK